MDTTSQYAHDPTVPPSMDTNNHSYVRPFPQARPAQKLLPAERPKLALISMFNEPNSHHHNVLASATKDGQHLQDDEQETNDLGIDLSQLDGENHHIDKLTVPIEEFDESDSVDQSSAISSLMNYGPSPLVIQERQNKKIDILLTPRQQQVMQNKIRERKKCEFNKNSNNAPLSKISEGSASNFRQDYTAKYMPNTEPNLSSRVGSNLFDSKRFQSTPNLLFDSKQAEFEQVDSSTPPACKKKLNKPSFHQRIRQFFKGKSHQETQVPDSGFQGSRGVKIKYFRYNASHRKANRKFQSPTRCELLEPIKIDPAHLLISKDSTQILESYDESCRQSALKTFQDFGVKFVLEQNKIVALEKQPSLTYCQDLTKNLALAFQTLALLELEADINQSLSTKNIQVSRPNFSSNRKAFSLAKLGSENVLIFGGNLTHLHVRDNERNKEDLELPSILKYMIDHINVYGLEEEGVFRISSTKNRLKKLEQELTELYNGYYKLKQADSPKDIENVLKKYNIHDVASLLKLFLRQLSPPLITNELMDIFLYVPAIPNTFVQIKILNLLMLTLNDTHRNSLCHLLNLLHRLVLYGNYNKVTLDGITTLIAANLFPMDLLASNESSCNQLDLRSPQQPPSSLTSSPLLFSNSRPIKTDHLIKSHRRISISSQSVNEISPAMVKHLKRTDNSLAVLKLLINLQSILFHIPTYLERQTYDQKKKAQVDQLIV